MVGAGIERQAEWTLGRGEQSKLRVMRHVVKGRGGHPDASPTQHREQSLLLVSDAGDERWLADSRTRKDWIYLTRTGEIVAKESAI